MHQGLTIVRSIAVAAFCMVLTSAAHAQQTDSKASGQRPKAMKPQSATQKPLARPRTTTSCSEFGAGFVRMAGSDTCVRVGGSIDVGVGMSR